MGGGRATGSEAPDFNGPFTGRGTGEASVTLKAFSEGAALGMSPSL